MSDMGRFAKAFWRQLRQELRYLSARAELSARYPQVKLEAGVVLKGDLQRLRFYGSAVVQSGTVLHVGDAKSEWSEGCGSIEIGAGAVISPNCVLYGAGPGGLRIGERFDCGPGVGIFASRSGIDAGERAHVFAPVIIGDDVIVFANAVISPGVTIGAGAVIAAGAVVTRDVPSGCVVGGAPARVLRERRRET